MKIVIILFYILFLSPILGYDLPGCLYMDADGEPRQAQIAFRESQGGSTASTFNTQGNFFMRSMWIKIKKLESSDYASYEAQYRGGSNEHRILTYSGGPALGTDLSSFYFDVRGRKYSDNTLVTKDVYTTNTSVKDGNWHNLVYIYDSVTGPDSTFKVYFDAVLIADETFTSAGLLNFSDAVARSSSMLARNNHQVYYTNYETYFLTDSVIDEAYVEYLYSWGPGEGPIQSTRMGVKGSFSWLPLQTKSDGEYINNTAYQNNISYIRRGMPEMEIYCSNGSESVNIVENPGGLCYRGSYARKRR